MLKQAPVVQAKKNGTRKGRTNVLVIIEDK